MAKKILTDTGKWNDDWFLELTTEMKLAWIFLCDNCNHDGLWKKSKSQFNRQAGFKVSLEEVAESLGSRVKDTGTHFFIHKTLAFHNTKLNSTNNKVLSIVYSLMKHDLIQFVSDLYGKDFLDPGYTGFIQNIKGYKEYYNTNYRKGVSLDMHEHILSSIHNILPDKTINDLQFFQKEDKIIVKKGEKARYLTKEETVYYNNNDLIIKEIAL